MLKSEIPKIYSFILVVEILNDSEKSNDAARLKIEPKSISTSALTLLL